MLYGMSLFLFSGPHTRFLAVRMAVAADTIISAAY